MTRFIVHLGCALIVVIVFGVAASLAMKWAAIHAAQATWHMLGRAIPGLTDPERVDPFNRVVAAIKNDNVPDYISARTACGDRCYPDMERSDEQRNFINFAIVNRSWRVLAVQIEMSPPIAQRLLHTVGSDYEGYEGSTDLVNFLLAHGARPDGLALANAVANCRIEMAQILLRDGADFRGEYPVPERFLIEEPESVVGEPRSLLDIASDQHCAREMISVLQEHGSRLGRPQKAGTESRHK